MELGKSRVFDYVFRVLGSEMLKLGWVGQDIDEVNRAAFDLADYLSLKGSQILYVDSPVLLFFLLNGLIKSLIPHIRRSHQISQRSHYN